MSSWAIRVLHFSSSSEINAVSNRCRAQHASLACHCSVLVSSLSWPIAVHWRAMRTVTWGAPQWFRALSLARREFQGSRHVPSWIGPSTPYLGTVVYVTCVTAPITKLKSANENNSNHVDSLQPTNHNFASASPAGQQETRFHRLALLAMCHTCEMS